jgi:curved DNA-binding protein CbpA
MAPPFTIEDSRRRFRELAKLYHPDAGKMPNGDMFARLGAAFQVLEENAEILSRKNLGIQSPTAASEKLIEELRQARLKSIKSEDEVNALKAETNALRLALKGKDAANPLKYVIIGILIFGAAVLGFLLGITRGFQKPIGTFAAETKIPIQILAADKVTVENIDNPTSPVITRADIRGAINLAGLGIEVESGQARLKGNVTTATVEITTGTVELNLPTPGTRR